MRVVRTSGYLAVYRPDHPRAWKQGFVFQHRLVMEEKLGRYLKANEVVHHKNGDTYDNRPENLEVLTNSQHVMLHRKEKPAAMIERPCAFCNQLVKRERRKTYNRKNIFCNRSCMGSYAARHRLWRPKLQKDYKKGSK